MKYEEKYNQCFDLIWESYYRDASIVSVLEDNGVKITDKRTAVRELFELFATWHERKIIEPV